MARVGSGGALFNQHAMILLGPKDFGHWKPEAGQGALGQLTKKSKRLEQSLKHPSIGENLGPSHPPSR